MANQHSQKLAVLIDAENAQAKIAGDLLGEIALYGTASVKRAYGDWTTPNLGSWREVLHELAIQPVQQFRFTTGKNATDSALIIDAMDLLHGGAVDGFCLLSSDSDFTRLATRIREAGLSVYGFGERKTPKPFVAACDKFIFTEILHSPLAGSARLPAGENLRPILESAVSGAEKDNRWSPLSGVGSLLMKSNPSFDPRNYGFQKLSELVKAQSFLEVKTVAHNDEPAAVQLFVRIKKVEPNGSAIEPKQRRSS